MKKLLRIVFVVSVLVNAGAMYVLFLWTRNAFEIHQHIQMLMESTNSDVVLSEYKVRYADDAFAFACTTNGSYVFHSLIDHMPITFSFERKGSRSGMVQSHRCMVSSPCYFASWHLNADKCDHVVFQYNDIGRKDDPDGKWDIRSSDTDRRLFFAENGYLKSQHPQRLLVNGDDKNMPSAVVSDSAELTDSFK